MTFFFLFLLGCAGETEATSPFTRLNSGMEENNKRHDQSGISTAERENDAPTAGNGEDLSHPTDTYSNRYSTGSTKKKYF